MENRMTAFSAYYKAQPKARRDALRKLIMEELFPDRNRHVFYNILHGKVRVYQRTIEQFIVVITNFDPSVAVDAMFPNMKNNLGKHLVLLNVSQTKLAELTKISQSSIACYVAGTRNPGTLQALLIAKVLDLDVEDVFPLPAEGMEHPMPAEYEKENKSR